MRKFAFVIAAVAATSGLLVIAAPQAGAASFQSNSTDTVSFSDRNDLAVECTVNNSTRHNTDNADQPYTFVTSGTSSSNRSCDRVLLTITVRYKDRNGAVRTATFSSFATGSAKVEGTYSSITTTVDGFYFDCNPDRSASCNATATSHPK